MTAPALRPCEPWSFPSTVTCDDETVKMAATEVLWALSGRRYGFCTVTVHPGLRGCGGCWRVQYRDVNGSAVPYIDSWAGCGHAGPCSCSTLGSEVKVPGPVAELQAVTLDGDSLAVSGAGAQVRVNDWRWVELLGDGLTWPECSSDDTTIVYQRGRAVPAMGELAMGELVEELCRSVAGQTCRLPARIREITRNGVTQAFLDPMDFLDRGRTGLTKVDLFLTAVNPKGLRRGARVYRADAHVNRRIGT